MKNHVRVYINFFGYCRADIIFCTVCGAVAVDIHHIDPRGMGGSKTKDFIENLIALCRRCHRKAEAKQFSVQFLTELQSAKIKAHKANK